MFRKELEVISNYADEHGSSPHASSCDKQGELDEARSEAKPAPGADDKSKMEINARSHADDDEISNRNDRTNVIDSNNITPDGVATIIRQTFQENTSDQGIVNGPGEAQKVDVQVTQPIESEKDIRSTQKGDRGNSASRAGTDPVTIVSGAEINPSSEQTVHLDGATQLSQNHCTPDTGTRFHDAEETEISGSMKAALAVAEQVEKDEDMARLVDHDNKVSMLASRCNIGRDECRFYLESTDWNVEEAINIYNSFN